MQAGAMSPDKRPERLINDGLRNAIAGKEALPCVGDDEGEPRPFSGLAVYDAVINLLFGKRAAYDAHLSMPNFRSFDAATAGMIRSKKVRALTRLSGRLLGRRVEEHPDNGEAAGKLGEEDRHRDQM